MFIKSTSDINNCKLSLYDYSNKYDKKHIFMDKKKTKMSLSKLISKLIKIYRKDYLTSSKKTGGLDYTSLNSVNFNSDSANINNPNANNIFYSMSRTPISTDISSLYDYTFKTYTNSPEVTLYRQPF